MKLLVNTMLFVSFQTSVATSWEEIFKEKKDLLEQQNCQLLRNQFDAFKNGSLPTIVDSRIKSIPIQDSNEPCSDVTAESNPRISMLPKPETPFASPDCNSGFTCASLMRKTVFAKLGAMLIYLDELAPEFGYKKDEVTIAVFEALRDLKTQEHLFENKRTEIKATNPTFTDAELDKETSKWVSPVKNNVPVHSTGAAIDIRLMCHGKLIDMGKFGVIWGSNPNAPTFSEDLTREQKMNRLFMAMAATKAGLTNYPYEFWHYSSGDRYDAYWNGSEEKSAQFGSVH